MTYVDLVSETREKFNNLHVNISVTPLEWTLQQRTVCLMLIAALG